MEDVLSKILDNIETINDLLVKKTDIIDGLDEKQKLEPGELNRMYKKIQNNGDTMQVVIDDLWKYIVSEQQKLWLESVREVK